MAKTIKFFAGLSLLLFALFLGLYLQFRLAWLLSACITAASFAYHFWMRLSVGLIFDRFMRNRADTKKAHYKLFPWEEKLYARLRVKSWKGRMPSYSPELFSPKEHSWSEIAQAMCQAELVHETIIVLSFLPLLASIIWGAFPVFLITSCLAAGFDLLFVMMQRYNRPRVLRLAEKEKAKEA